jgi:cytochrome b subunit of formate dehydrogenase
MHRTSRLLAAIGFLLLAPAALLAAESENCLDCHGDPWLFDGYPGAERLVIPEAKHLATLHGALGVGCAGCHADFGQAEGRPHIYHRELRKAKPVACGMCHQEPAKAFKGGLHGYALSRGNARAPRCTTCHGTHDILSSSDRRSATHKANLPAKCAECHGTAGLLTDQFVKLPESFRDYAESVHGQHNSHGDYRAASCDDCHQVHALRNSADPESPIHQRNVATTCGKCHPDRRDDYVKSIHGRAVAAGISDSPTCTSCHGEHLILSPSDPKAKTNASRLATETCGRCHDDPIIVAKYHLRGGVVGSYRDSYHGWVTRRQFADAATCVSCHTAHLVLPVADPESTVSPGRVVETCRQCHAGATERFARSYDHRSASISANPVNYWIRYGYLFLIAGLIGAMILHNLVIMNYYMVQRRREEKASRWVLRFDRAQIVQHMVLTVAFIMLAVTGFALRYPDAFWVKALHWIGLTEPVRSVLHRIFAVILLGVGFSHVYYVLLTRRGRGELRALSPSLRDVRELSLNMKFHTWRSADHVKFGRYDYSQKAEYWALIWGTFVMILTGFVLWFPEFFVTLLPVWSIGAAQTIHFYEAWLATLAILVWHFFFVIFHPEEYPMSWTWLTGRMSEKSAKLHHRAWYEAEARTGGVKPGDEGPEPHE